MKNCCGRIYIEILYTIYVSINEFVRVKGHDVKESMFVPYATVKFICKYLRAFLTCQIVISTEYTTRNTYYSSISFITNISIIL